MENLTNCYLFKYLNKQEIEKLKSIAKKVNFKKGNILFYEREEPKYLILLTSGILHVYKTDMKGNKITIHYFYPNSLIAEITNLEHLPYPATAEFVKDGEVLLIDYEKFEKEFLKNPQISYEFIKSLAKKIKFLENVITNDIIMNSTSRVAKFIYENEDDFLSMKKSEIAQNLHMTPETLSRVLKKLKKLKLIEKYENSYKILNREGLKSIYE